MSCQMKLLVRWMIRRDVPETMAINSLSFDNPWQDEAELVDNYLKRRNTIGMVAELDGRIVGYCVYSLYKQHIQIESMAVHPAYRELGLGRVLVERLFGKLSRQRRDRVCVDVRESDLPAQTFFRHLDFLAYNIRHGHFRDTGEDAYQMFYVKGGRRGERLPGSHNRISQYFLGAR